MSCRLDETFLRISSVKHVLRTPRPALPPLSSFIFVFYSGTPNGKAGDHYTCHISSWRSQLFLVSVHCAPLRTPQGSRHLSARRHKYRPQHLCTVARAPTFKLCSIVHVHSEFVCMYILIRAPLSVPTSFSPNWTINKQYNMAPQEAPSRPVG